MSIAQRAEADLLRQQLTSIRAAADIEITAARTAQTKAEKSLEGAAANFRQLIYVAAAGWALFTVLAVTSALHYGMDHYSSTPGAAVEAPAAPVFLERSK